MTHDRHVYAIYFLNAIALIVVILCKNLRHDWTKSVVFLWLLQCCKMRRFASDYKFCLREDPNTPVTQTLRLPSYATALYIYHTSATVSVCTIETGRFNIFVNEPRFVQKLYP